ncbi:signal peptidase I [Anaerovorax odorimutans]|uniref:signal peptidase I n=1 Tax=Anaerovorax odorimutans TaxID=109327 RepID=UPI0004169764|nr:signal peptidase I [Anaerovorax odorimutans]
MTGYDDNNKSFKEKYKIYIYPVILAWIMTMFIRPIVSDGEAMLPTIKDRQVIIVSKENYSKNRGVPEFQQVVAFKKDFIQDGDKGDNTIRRVIGLPGDKIQIKDGKVYRNGKTIKENYISGEIKGDFGPIIVGEEEVFVLGDNRSNSIDSRDERVGTLDMSLIRGSCKLVIWPLNEFGKIE